MSGDSFLLDRLASVGLTMTNDELSECLRLADRYFHRHPFTSGEVVWCLSTLAKYEPAATPRPTPRAEGGE